MVRDWQATANAAETSLASLIGGSGRQLALSAWLSVVVSLLVVAELACIGLAIAEVLHTGTVAAAFSSLLLFLALAAARIAMDGASAALAARAAEAVKFRAREAIADALAASSPIDRNRIHAGEAAALLTGHVDALSPYLVRYRPARLRAAILPAAILMITAWFSWVAAAVLLVTGPLIPIFMALIGAEARTASERQLREIGSMNAGILDRLRGLTTLRIFDAIPRAALALEREGERIRMRTMAVLRIAFLSSAVLELFAALGVAFAAVYVGFSLLGHINFGAYGTLSLSSGLILLMIAPEYFRPLRDFAAAYHDKAAALAASGEIGRVLAGSRLLLPKQKTRSANLTSLAIEKASVSLEGSTILPAFSLHIEPGQRIALTGPSGSGKSMLLALIGGLIRPTGGRVLVNGEPDVCCRTAWLGQRPAFIHGSVAANLAMYRGGIDRKSMADAAASAQADEVIARLNRGYHETLRENAANFSGGEAQRLAIARLALSDASLILADEPTEHLDDATAMSVIDGLLELCRGRTLVVATHDPRVISRMDRVIDVRRLHRADPFDVAA